MIEARSFAGKSAAVFGMGMSGIAAARSLLAGGAKVLAWDDGERGREAARAAGLPLWRSARGGLERHRRAGAGARRAAHPPRAALDGEARPRAWRRGHRRHRDFHPRAQSVGHRGQGDRHHRHERQIHHHGADPSHPHVHWRGRGAWRQYRQGRARPAAFRGRPLLRDRVFELPARPDAKSRRGRRDPAQRHAGPYRPPRQP